MEVRRSAGMQINFPSDRGTGRSWRRRGPGGRGGGPAAFTEAKRQYDQEIQRLNDFFDLARQYQKERAANAPGFKKDLKMEAMLPVLEGKEPVAISASRERQIHDAIQFIEKQHVKAVILQPRELDKEAAELKSHNIPGDSGPHRSGVGE